MRMIEKEEIEQLLDEKTCIAAMRETLCRLENGEGVQYLRSPYQLPGGEIFAFMPAWLDGEIFGAKVLTVFHHNAKAGYPSHQGSVLLFGARHGNLLAMLDATSITQIRTGAVSAFATDLLARPDAGHLCLLGCGAQAVSHLRAIRHVRKLHKVTVWDIASNRSHDFATRMGAETGLSIRAEETVQAALQGADIICTLTPAKEPILKDEWIAEGAHINAVGACLPADRELPSKLMARAKVYGDAIESVLKESGDFLIPMKEGLYTKEHLRGTLGALALGSIKGRSGPKDITVFEALGLAIEDIAAARAVYLAGIDNK